MLHFWGGGGGHRIKRIYIHTWNIKLWLPHTHARVYARGTHALSPPGQFYITFTHCVQTQCNISLPLSLYRHIRSREMTHKLCQHEPHQTWVSILTFSSSHWVQPFQQCVARLNSKHDQLLAIIHKLHVSSATYHFPPHAVLEIEEYYYPLTPTDVVGNVSCLKSSYENFCCAQ